jgi:hypothetical protein
MPGEQIMAAARNGDAEARGDSSATSTGWGVRSR